MTSAQICIMIAIIVYLIGMIYIGFRCSKKNNSTDISIWVAENSVLS